MTAARCSPSSAIRKLRATTPTLLCVLRDRARGYFDRRRIDAGEACHTLGA